MMFPAASRTGKIITSIWIKVFGVERVTRIFVGFDKVMPMFVLLIAVVVILYLLGKIAITTGIIASVFMIICAVLFGLLGLNNENRS